jgi:microcystin degradation protein MlrC
VVDPVAAAAAAAADGQTLALTLGGRLDPARHQPVAVHGRCRRVAQTRVTFNGGIGDGLTADMGTAAVVQVKGLQILLMAKPAPCYDPALYRTAGLDPARAQAVVVKSPNNFRWAFREIARAWLYVDAPGASTPRLASLPFRRAPRPLFPLDDWDWRPASGSYVKGESRVVD